MALRWLLVIALLSVGACVSPEAERTRGGGPGADQQNRPADVKMHEGSTPYWNTPVVIEVEPPPMAPAEHARTLSRQ